MTTNHVLALKVVLPDGEVAELGSDSLESVEADYVGLFGGSEGLFGIALEITVRLLPKPEVCRTLLAAYRSLEAAGDAVSSVIASGLLPGAMEIMDHLSIQAAEAAVHPGYPLDAAALLIVELEGERAQVEAEWQRLRQVIDASQPYLVKVAQNDEERAKIWKGRKSAFSAVGRLSPITSSRMAWCPAGGWARRWPRSRSSAPSGASGWPTSSTPATATCTR